MDKIGVKESDLKCGVHPPLSKNMQNKMLIRGEQPSQIHNNCSGKHL
jgi:L-asparaginase II